MASPAHPKDTAASTGPETPDPPETPEVSGAYEAPRITFRQRLDRVAADCSLPPGKSSPVQGCSQGSS